MFQTQKKSPQCLFTFVRPPQPQLRRRNCVSSVRSAELKTEREYTEAVLRERNQLRGLKNELALLSLANDKLKPKKAPAPSYLELGRGWRETAASEAWQSKNWLSQSFIQAKQIAARMRGV
jgi:hypothetical protein